MKRHLLSILVILVLANTLFALGYIEGYKKQKSYKSWENAARYFMGVKMYQLRQGGTQKFLGFFNKDFYSDELKDALWKYDKACITAIRDRLVEMDYDPNEQAWVKMLRPTLPDERNSWEGARGMFAAGANRRWIDSQAAWSAKRRSSKLEDLESDAYSVAMGIEVFEDYFEDFMLQNLEWFRDKDGRLHIPDFLMDKYKKKYQVK